MRVVRRPNLLAMAVCMGKLNGTYQACTLFVCVLHVRAELTGKYSRFFCDIAADICISLTTSLTDGTSFIKQGWAVGKERAPPDN